MLTIILEKDLGFWRHMQDLYGFVYIMYSMMNISYIIIVFHVLRQNELQPKIQYFSKAKTCLPDTVTSCHKWRDGIMLGHNAYWYGSSFFYNKTMFCTEKIYFIGRLLLAIYFV
jgi:hypothetical protein